MRLKFNIAKCSLLILPIVFAACNGKYEGNNDSNEFAPDAENVTDAIVVSDDSIPNEVNIDSIDDNPKLSFASTQAAIEYMTSSPDAAKYAEGILPRMAEDDLSYTTKLLNNKYDKFLIIDKALMRVGLFDKWGREILSYGIACSRNYGTKHKRADNRTPEGFFSVEGIYDSTNWLFTNDNGYTSPAKGQFGPRFIRIKNPVSYQIGLHGTASPGSIGRRTSHGCIRVTNENILELVKYVTPGMPVIISPSKRDQQVNEREGYHVAMVTMDPYGKYQESANGLPYEPAAKKSSSTLNSTTEATQSEAPMSTEISSSVEEAPAAEEIPATHSIENLE